MISDTTSALQFAFTSSIYPYYKFLRAMHHIFKITFQPKRLDSEIIKCCLSCGVIKTPLSFLVGLRRAGKLVAPCCSHELADFTSCSHLQTGTANGCCSRGLDLSSWNNFTLPLLQCSCLEHFLPLVLNRYWYSTKHGFVGLSFQSFLTLLFLWRDCISKSLFLWLVFVYHRPVFIQYVFM